MNLKLKVKEEVKENNIDQYDEDSEYTFEQWAMKKYRDICTRINPCNDDNKLDPVRLNEVLSNFANDFSWAILVSEIESNKLNILQHDYDQWYKEKFAIVHRLIKEETMGAGRAPSQATVDARLVETYADENSFKKHAIIDQRSRCGLLSGFVKMLDKQASILQTISSNMRSELFFAAGVPISGQMSPVDRNKAAKAALNNAIKSHEATSSGS